MTANEEILMLKVATTCLTLVLGLAVWGLWHLRRIVEQKEERSEQRQHKTPQ